MWKQDQRRQAIRGGRQEDGLLRVISGLAMTGWRWARVPRLARAPSARRAAIALLSMATNNDDLPYVHIFQDP